MFIRKIKKGIKILREEGLKEFLIRFFYFINTKTTKILEVLFYPYIVFKLKKIQSNNLEEIISFAWNSFFGVIRPTQIKEEILELLKIIKDQKPKYILEIGTANGGTLFLFTKIAPDDATIISIDLPKGPFGGGYPMWRSFLYQKFKKPNQKMILLREDSHKKETLEELKKILNGNQLDFLFIDGDHSYEGVKKDFQMYGSLVKKGGIVAFHDIAPKGVYELAGEVPRFWQEISKQFNVKNIIFDENNQIAYGIGLLLYDDEK